MNNTGSDVVVSMLMCRARFWVDFAAWFPFDWIVLWCFNAAESDNFHRWLGLLTLLRMVRTLTLPCIFCFWL